MKTITKPITINDYKWKPPIDDTCPCKDCIIKPFMRVKYKSCHDHCDKYQKWSKGNQKRLETNLKTQVLRADLRVCHERAMRKQKYNSH